MNRHNSKLVIKTNNVVETPKGDSLMRRTFSRDMKSRKSRLEIECQISSRPSLTK